MYAIVEIGGHQYKVKKTQEIFVNRLEGKEGDKVTFDQVLLLDNEGKVNVGTPVIQGAQVSAKIVEHLKSDKVLVFKKKRRKGYKKKNGHRQYITKILIDAISEKGGKVAASPKKEVKNVEAEAKKKEETKAATKKVTKAGDDLKKIEGIGPKIASVLTEAGVDTYKKLAKAKPEDIKEILTKASDKYAVHDPETWPKQAQLAAEDKWDELKKWQDELDGGKA